jgi:hypothetical protein
MGSVMLDRILSMLVALSLALLVWLYARSRDQETLDNVSVPVQVSVAPAQADHYSLEMTGPNHVLVSFTGPPTRIRELQGLLQHNELQVALTVTVPDEHLQEARYSEMLHIDSADVLVPAGVVPVIVEGRNRIAVTLHRLVERRLPVRFDSVSEEPVGPVIIEPATVLVRGPQDVLDRARAIPTQPSEVPGPLARVSAPGASPGAGRVPLVTELEGRPVRVVPGRVSVRVPGQTRKVYELTDLPIHFLCPADFTLRPRFFDERSGRVSLRVQGPVQEEPPRVNAFIDLTRARFVSGGNHEPLQIQLPKDFQLAQDPPRVVAFELLPADFVPKGMGNLPPP